MISGGYVKIITTLHWGGYGEMITILHRGGYAQMITILHGGGVSRDPQKWLRNMCTTPKREILLFSVRWWTKKSLVGVAMEERAAAKNYNEAWDIRPLWKICIVVVGIYKRSVLRGGGY